MKYKIREKRIVFRHHVVMAFPLDFDEEIAKQRLIESQIQKGYVPLNITVERTKYLIVSCYAGYAGKRAARNIGYQEQNTSMIIQPYQTI